MRTEDVKEQLFQILGLMEEERKNATVKCCLSNGDSVYFWFDTLHDGQVLLVRQLGMKTHMLVCGISCNILMLIRCK